MIKGKTFKEKSWLDALEEEYIGNDQYSFAYSRSNPDKCIINDIFEEMLHHYKFKCQTDHYGHYNKWEVFNNLRMIQELLERLPITIYVKEETDEYYNTIAIKEKKPNHIKEQIALHYECDMSQIKLIGIKKYKDIKEDDKILFKKEINFFS